MLLNSCNNIPDVAQLLLDLANSFEISGSVEGITSIEQKLDEMSRYMTTSHIQTTSQVLWCETLVDRDLIRGLKKAFSQVTNVKP